MKYSDARPLVEAVAELGVAYREAERVNGDDAASQEDVILAGEAIAVAVAKRNRAFDAATGAEPPPPRPVEGETEQPAGAVSEQFDPPAAGAQAEGTAEPGAAEKTREAGQTPDQTGEAAATGDQATGPVETGQQAAEGAQTANAAAQGGQEAETLQTGEQVLKNENPA